MKKHEKLDLDYVIEDLQFALMEMEVILFSYETFDKPHGLVSLVLLNNTIELRKKISEFEEMRENNQK